MRRLEQEVVMRKEPNVQIESKNRVSKGQCSSARLQLRRGESVIRSSLVDSSVEGGNHDEEEQESDFERP